MNSPTKSALGTSLEAMGVDALLAAVEDHSNAPPLVNIPTNNIKASSTLQPRQHIDEARITELSESIKKHGILQPILVRPTGIDQYEIIAGERRFQACQMADIESIPCIIKEVTDREGLAIAIVENLQREALNPIEAAEALSSLIDRHQYTHISLAESIGMSRSSVSNMIRLLNLNPDVKHMVYMRELDMGHARALLAVPSEKQASLAKKIVANRLSVRATENLVKTSSMPRAPKTISPYTQTIQKYHPKASVQVNPSGRSGFIKLPFKNIQELETLLSSLSDES